MTDEQKFLAAIRKQPDDSVTRLVYADWLQEHEDSRGELIRIEEEIRDLPIYSDRYWQLKPRRRELLPLAEKTWLKKMGYGSTDYQPVFADVPKGWKERWRLLREFVERWYSVLMDDVGGPLKPVPITDDLYPGVVRGIQSIEDAMANPKIAQSLSKSVCEWMLFFRDFQLCLPKWHQGTGDDQLFYEVEDWITFMTQDGGREGISIQKRNRRKADPEVWRQFHISGEPECIAPSVTSFALQYLLMHYDYDHRRLGDSDAYREPLTKEFLKRAESYFTVHSELDGLHIFERQDVIALWMPDCPWSREKPALRVKWRHPVTQDDIAEGLSP